MEKYGVPSWASEEEARIRCSASFILIEHIFLFTFCIHLFIIEQNTKLSIIFFLHLCIVEWLRRKKIDVCIIYTSLMKCYWWLIYNLIRKKIAEFRVFREKHSQPFHLIYGFVWNIYRLSLIAYVFSMVRLERRIYELTNVYAHYKCGRKRRREIEKDNLHNIL